MSRTKTTTTAEVEQAVESLPFKLELPTELNITPWVTVDMPRNKVAMVYHIQADDYASEPAKKVEAYAVYIVSKKTFKSGDNQYTHSRGQNFNNVPAVKHYLYDMAAAMTVKRKTRKMVDVVDLHDTDEDD